MSAAARKPVSADRRALIAKVHLGAKDLRLDEETRRDLLDRVTGHRSSVDCTDRQLVQVLDEYRRLGWTPTSTSAVQRPAAKPSSAPQRAAAHPVAKKARAIWISLHQLGVVRSSSEKALQAFAKRQLHVDRLQWADQSQGFRLIEALKAMAERAGWAQGLDGIKPERQVWTLKARLANAQLRKLGRPALRSMDLTERDLDKVVRDLAVEIHAADAEGDQP